MSQERAQLWRRARTAASLLDRARTAASLLDRVVASEETLAYLMERVAASEERLSALEGAVMAKLDEVRGEFAEVRLLLGAQFDSDGDATALLGRLLQETRSRIDALEEAVFDSSSLPTREST